MRTFFKVSGTLILALFAALASSTAMADGYRGHGYYGHGHGGVRFGISLGVPLYGLGYDPPYYAYPGYAYPAPVYGYPPVVMGPASPPVYVEQGAVQAAPAPSQVQGDWYYCAASKAYYPYVAECAAGWQRVPAQPPSR
ncbi:MAG: hypothetical protein MUP61_03890 [Burkholderiales bacterium]|nr:hypothetical protein [Burkholderiales bacterium]